MRYLMLIALAGLVAWMAGTLYDIGLSVELLMRAGNQWTEPALTLLMANQRLLYVGAAMGLVAAIFVGDDHPLPRQWLSWGMVAAFVYVATLWGQHVLTMPGVAEWRDFLPRRWWRTDLLVAVVVTAFLTPLIRETASATWFFLRTLRRPRLRAHSTDVDFDGAVDREGIARAEAYLAEKRRKVAAGGGKGAGADWSLEPRDQ